MHHRDLTDGVFLGARLEADDELDPPSDEAEAEADELAVVRLDPALLTPDVADYRTIPEKIPVQSTCRCVQVTSVCLAVIEINKQQKQCSHGDYSTVTLSKRAWVGKTLR